MSADFDTKLVYDARLKDISDRLDYGVRKGGSDVTWQKFKNNSQSSSSMNFTVNPPSESTVIDRRIFIKSVVKFQIAVAAGVKVGQSVFDYGLNHAFQSFPLNRLFNTVTLSVNNVSTSVNQNHMLPVILRMIPQRVLQESEGLTPTMLDQWGQIGYTDARSSVTNNPLSGFKQAGYDCLLQPRGVHPLDSMEVRRTPGDGAPVDAVLESGNLLDTWEIDITATFVEPLFVSPCLFGDAKFNHSGFLGINNFQLVINVDSAMQRFLSGGLPLDNNDDPVPVNNYTLKLLPDPFQGAELLLNFLTAPMPLVLPPKAVLPYSSYTSYITSQPGVLPGGTDEFTVNSLQLEVVPDKIYIINRKKLSDQRFTDPDTFMTISNASITFGNKSGLLSNANKEQLYKMSRKNGSQQDWYAFSGTINISDTAVLAHRRTIPTQGSVLVIDPANDLGIQAPYLSNGSVGQFSLQVSMTVKNNTADPIANCETVIIIKRDGILTTVSGQSTLTTNMLNTDIVMRTIQGDSDPMSSAVEDRLVGGMGELPAHGYQQKGKRGGARSGGASDLGSRLAALAM
jgi:hypothetical protein